MEHTYEFREVNTKFIMSDRDYQREVNEARVSAMLKAFDPDLINAPKLSFRDGRYYVFDGAHTVALLKARNGGKDTTIACKVFYGLTKIDEAKLFEEQNGIVSSVTAAAKIRSMVYRGDETAVNAVRIAESHGFKINYSNGQARNAIVAIKSLYKLVDRYGVAAYSNVLHIIRAAWDGSIESVRREILEGLAIFCDVYAGKYNCAILIKKLQSVSPIEIVRDGNVSRNAGAKKYARQIVAIYNKNTRNNRLDEML